MYIIAEMIGSILGYGLLYAVTPQKHFETAPGSSGLCITNLHPSVSVAQGFFIEFFLVAVLVLVVCSVWDPRNKDKADSACIKIGELSSKIQIHSSHLTKTFKFLQA